MVMGMFFGALIICGLFAIALAANTRPKTAIGELIKRGSIIGLAFAGLYSAYLGISQRDSLFQTEKRLSSKIDESDQKLNTILAELRRQAASNGIALDAEAEASIAESIEKLLASTDARKARAREALSEGNIEEAASRLMTLGEQEGAGADGMAKAAAESFKEAGALWFANDTFKAIEAYEQARKYAPDDLEVMNYLATLKLRIGELDEAIILYRLIAEADASDEWNAVAYANLWVLVGTRDDVDAAVVWLKKSLELKDALSRKVGIAIQYGYLGNAAFDRGDSVEAIELTKKAICLFRSTGADSAQGAQISENNLRDFGGDPDALDCDAILKD